MDIKSYVNLQKEKMRNEVNSLAVKPHLVIIQVNEDPASNSYIKGKLKDAEEIGIKATLVKLPLDVSMEELLKKVQEINEDNSVHGLIVQMPLPSHIDEAKVKLAIEPRKDVDGFHPLSLYKACTPKGIIDYLTSEGIKFEDKNAVVIGRSNIVGKPLSSMLTALNCNTTILHSKTSKENMDNYLRNADIVCIAIGKKGYLKNGMLKKSAVVVDVGINRVDGVLYGDAEANLDVYLQTPVPGGVGLLTRLTLMKNLMEAYNNEISSK